jgi:hypothetical protein
VREKRMSGPVKSLADDKTEGQGERESRDDNEPTKCSGGIYR